MLQRWTALVLVALVLAPLGCGAPGVSDIPGGPEGNPKKGDLAERSTSLGRASSLVGIGEGSLWLTDHGDYVCDDTPGVASAEAVPPKLVSCVVPGETFLRRVDPGSREAASTVRFEGTDVAGVAFGADAVWLSLNGRTRGGGAVAKLDPGTNRITDRVRVKSPSGMDFGGGSLWVASQTGTVSRIDPEAGEIEARIGVSAGGANDVAVDDGSGSVWVAVTGLPDSWDDLSH